MHNRALTWYKNSHWIASPDSQYQQQQFVQVERLIWSQSTQATMEVLHKEATKEARYSPGTALPAWRQTKETAGHWLMAPVTGIYTGSFLELSASSRKG